MRSGNNNAPIGVFDSGFGGLTVARQIAQLLPDESITYFGDTARNPYGPRDMSEVDGFVQQICAWLVKRDVKLMVIACNTGAAAGLQDAQANFEIPVLGVVNPGARAAVHATNTRRIGVIATQGTIHSKAYPEAIHHIDAGIKVFSVATPQFVKIVEKELPLLDKKTGSYDRQIASVFKRSEYIELAESYLDPLMKQNIDTLVLGCTHFPIIQDLIVSVTGKEVTLISSADEVARDVLESLSRKGIRAGKGHQPKYEFFTTGNDVNQFKVFSKYVFGLPVDSVSHVRL